MYILLACELRMRVLQCAMARGGGRKRGRGAGTDRQRQRGCTRYKAVLDPSWSSHFPPLFTISSTGPFYRSTMRLLQQLLNPLKRWIAISNALTRSTTPPTPVPDTFPIIDALTHVDRDCTVHPSAEVRDCRVIFRSSIGLRVIISGSIVEFCTKISESWVTDSTLNQAEVERHSIISGSKILRSHVIGSYVTGCVLRDSVVCCGAFLYDCTLTGSWVCGGLYWNCEVVRSGLVRGNRKHSTQRLPVVDHWATEADFGEEVYVSPEDEERTMEYWRTHRQSAPETGSGV